MFLLDILVDFVAMEVLPFDDEAGSQFETLRRQRVRIGTGPAGRIATRYSTVGCGR
jgi:hypothetical protein